MSYLKKHPKKDSTYLFMGLEMTEEYLIMIQVPMLLDALKWSPSVVYRLLEDVEAPIRHIKLTEYRKELEEQRLKDVLEAERLESHRRANYPTLSERQEDEKHKEKLKADKAQYIESIKRNRSPIQSSPYQEAHIEAIW